MSDVCEKEATVFFAHDIESKIRSFCDECYRKRVESISRRTPMTPPRSLWPLFDVLAWSVVIGFALVAFVGLVTKFWR